MDKLSGKDFDRPQYKKLLKKLEEAELAKNKFGMLNDIEKKAFDTLWNTACIDIDGYGNNIWNLMVGNFEIYNNEGVIVSFEKDFSDVVDYLGSKKGVIRTTVPFLYKMSDATGWFTHNDLANMIAVSESTPGPIGVNMATYVGFITGMNQFGTLGAILGSIVATLGLIAPSVIVILIIASFLKNFKDNPYVNRAFYGLRPASMGLIASAGVTVILSNLFGAKEFTDLAFDKINWMGIVLAIVLWICHTLEIFVSLRISIMGNRRLLTD